MRYKENMKDVLACVSERGCMWISMADVIVSWYLDFYRLFQQQ